MRILCFYVQQSVLDNNSLSCYALKWPQIFINEDPRLGQRFIESIFWDLFPDSMNVFMFGGLCKEVGR